MIIHALQDEILALIAKQRGLLARLQAETLLWSDMHADAEITTAKLDGYLQGLSSDQHKVTALESTIAVIGTMKAGKSTTINALIGEDVLPHRVTAMTTLPTLIRHKPGQTLPVLTLKNTDVFQQLINAVLDKVNCSGLHDSDRSKLQEAITTVESAGQIQASYEGKEAIHKVLAVVNDTFRLAGHERVNIDLDAQLQHFTEISTLPTVEVEFRCLAGMPESQYPGSLALLDTPGPNEAGQSRVLKKILTEQIEMNASMIMLVMNYTQLNTEQDSDIRNQLRGIKDVFKDRSFVVVNRFDERKKGDLNEEQTRTLASELLNDSMDDDDFISAGQVFPISSHRAFIAGNARRQIDAGISVEDFIADESNENFISAAFGMADEEELEEKTIDEIATMCDRLLKKSGYELFLKNMLERAYMKAGKNSLESALGRLNSYSAIIDRYSTAVSGGLAQELDDLNESIRKTHDLVASVDGVYQQIDSVKKAGVEGYRQSAHNVLSDFESKVQESIEKLFTAEYRSQSQALNQELEEKEKEVSKINFVDDIFCWLPKKRERKANLKKEIDDLISERQKRGPSSGELDFGDSSEEARNFLGQSMQLVDSLFTEATDYLSQTMKALETESKQRIQSTLFDEIKGLFDAYEQQMRKKGFDFNVSLLDAFSLNVVTQNDSEIDLSDALEKEERTTFKIKRVRVDRTGFWHSTLKILSFGYRDDHEYETRLKKVEVANYTISLTDLVARAVSQLQSFCSEVDSNLIREFEQTLVPAVDEVFAQVASSIKSVEEALGRSKKLKEQNAESINKLRSVLVEVKNQNQKVVSRVATAADGLKTLVD